MNLLINRDVCRVKLSGMFMNTTNNLLRPCISQEMFVKERNCTFRAVCVSTNMEIYVNKWKINTNRYLYGVYLSCEAFVFVICDPRTYFLQSSTSILVVFIHDFEEYKNRASIQARSRGEVRSKQHAAHGPSRLSIIMNTMIIDDN